MALNLVEHHDCTIGSPAGVGAIDSACKQKWPAKQKRAFEWLLMWMLRPNPLTALAQRGKPPSAHVMKVKRRCVAAAVRCRRLLNPLSPQPPPPAFLFRPRTCRVKICQRGPHAQSAIILGSGISHGFHIEIPDPVRLPLTVCSARPSSCRFHLSRCADERTQHSMPAPQAHLTHARWTQPESALRAMSEPVPSFRLAPSKWCAW